MAFYPDIGKYDLLPCPFCGREVDSKEPDAFHPSAIYWREEDGLRHYVFHKDRLDTDNQCWEVNCAESTGGCGAHMSGDTKEEAAEKWNTRKLLK